MFSVSVFLWKFVLNMIQPNIVSKGLTNSIAIFLQQSGRNCNLYLFFFNLEVFHFVQHLYSLITVKKAKKSWWVVLVWSNLIEITLF